MKLFGNKKEREELDQMREQIRQIRLILWSDSAYLDMRDHQQQFNPQKNEYVREVMKENVKRQKPTRLTYDQWLNKNCPKGCGLCKECREELDGFVA